MQGAGEDQAGSTVRVAATGDIHCRDANRDQVIGAFAHLGSGADVVLVAGDITGHGDPREAEILVEACGELGIPVVAVLGNHDWHADRQAEIADVLRRGSITVLDGASTTLELEQGELGIAGAKGFVGGFPGSHLSDFGEPSLRALHGEGEREVQALDRALHEIATCPRRIAVLHYAPTAETLAGEPEGIWTYLGTDRLAAPIREHEPDLVVHGHAHVGSFRGSIANVPVFNVSVPVMQRDFWVFELEAPRRPPVPVH